MWLLPTFRAALAWALLSLVLGTELSLQESLLLKSLGLSAKPSPKAPIPVPSVLWRIFEQRRTLPAAERAAEDGCRVEEFNVPGNIIRVFADRGTESPGRGPALGKLLCSLGWETLLQVLPWLPLEWRQERLGEDRAVPRTGLQERSLLGVGLGPSGGLWVPYSLEGRQQVRQSSAGGALCSPEALV